MSKVYEENNIKARIDLAVNYISNNRNTSRTFDTCFEMGDAHEVFMALLKRAEKNIKLKNNLPKYINPTNDTERKAWDKLYRQNDFYEDDYKCLAGS